MVKIRRRYDNQILKKVSYKNTATAIVVVQRPFLSPSADWQVCWVLMILPLALYVCSRSDHAAFTSNSIPSVVASMVAARSSAYSPVFSCVSPKAWCSDRYPYSSESLGSARPIADDTRRFGSLVSFRAMTQNTMPPGRRHSILLLLISVYISGERCLKRRQGYIFQYRPFSTQAQKMRDGLYASPRLW